ncbi:MAG: DUF72 domain-containing protein [Candidatus Hodarchaeales archaeon]|jgi:uncharacterized protein YecE (DUF72 family)
MIFLGTAGWSYAHWRGVFYPRGVKNELEFYSKHSLLNEINSTFYRIPSKSTVSKWYYSTPENFNFSVKLIRDITHSLKNKFNQDKVIAFFSHMKLLEEKLQAILIQFPPRFKNTPGNLHFLLQLLSECLSRFSGRFVVEFRDESWFNDEVRALLQDRSVSVVDTTTLGIPEKQRITSSDLYYIRFLGDREIIPDEKLGQIYLNKTEERQLWIRKLIHLNSLYETIFVVINNRFSGYAINDAVTLQKVLTKEKIEVNGFEKSESFVKRQMTLSKFF